MSNFVDFELPDTLDEDIAEDFLLSTKESIESIEHDLVILEWIQRCEHHSCYFPNTAHVKRQLSNVLF